jgi:hypothetical protein
MTENIENIPQANELLYTMKLTSGEELIFTLVDEKQYGIYIESPIVIRTIPILGDNGLTNELNSQLFMPFSGSRTFYIPNESIMILSKMHPDSHKLYTKLVNKLENYSTMDSPIAHPEHHTVQ